MVHLKVACCIRPAVRLRHNMRNSPAGVHCDGLLTVGTHAILPHPDAVQLTATARRVQHLLAPSGFEVRRPVRIVRIGARLALDMPFDWRVCGLQQGDLSCRAILLACCPRKCTVVSSDPQHWQGRPGYSGWSFRRSDTTAVPAGLLTHSRARRHRIASCSRRSGVPIRYPARVRR